MNLGWMNGWMDEKMGGGRKNNSWEVTWGCNVSEKSIFKGL